MPRGGPAGLSGCTARRVGACRRTCSSSAAVASCAASCASSASTRSCDDASAASSCSSGVRLPCRAAWRARSALCAWPEEGARSQATQTGKNANRVRVRIMRPAAHNLGACLPHRSTRRWCKCAAVVPHPLRLARFAPRSRAQRGQAAACERGQRHDGRDATACGTAAARFVAHARCGTARAATLGASQARHLVSYVMTARAKQARARRGKSPTALLRRALLTTTNIKLGHSYTSSHSRTVSLSLLPDASIRPPRRVCSARCQTRGGCRAAGARASHGPHQRAEPAGLLAPLSASPPRGPRGLGEAARDATPLPPTNRPTATTFESGVIHRDSLSSLHPTSPPHHHYGGTPSA